MENTIKLDDKWRIEPDAYSWKLIFSEEREKEEKVKVDGKIKNTGNKVKYDHEEDWYFPTIQMCLQEYLKHVFKADKTILEVNERLLSIEEKLKEIKGTFKK